MIKGRDQEALKIAAAPTLQQMRRDRKALPRKLSKLMTYLVSHLFKTGLTATLALDKAKIKDHTLQAAFRDGTGLTLRRYIERRRLEIADRMVRFAPEVELCRISLLVGFQYHGTFVDAYKKWLHETPSEARRRGGPPAIDYLEWRRYLRGDCEADAAWGVHETGLRLYPSIEERLRERYRMASGEPVIEVGSPRKERWCAEGIWQELRALPFEEQKRLLRGVRFHSTVLFDLLRAKSREEGRRSRQRGIEVAELALVSLEGSGEVFGQRIHDLRALGWAWLGNAHRLALDFPAACAAFKRTYEHWSEGRAIKEPAVAAEINFLQGTLRMSQRSYDAALELVDRSRSLFRVAASAEGEIRALSQRASICAYAGSSEEAVVALQEAVTLLGGRQEPYLAFAVWGNLANVQARVGQYSSAKESLERARLPYASLGHPVGALELAWIDANIKEGLGSLEMAAKLYSKARDGFCKVGESRHFSLASLDLTALNARMSRPRERS